MNKKRIVAVLLTMALTVVLTMNSIGTEVKASGTTILYKDAYGQRAININEYAKSMKLEVKSYDGNNAFYININGKGLIIYPTHKNVYIDGTGVPLKTEVVKDYFSGADFNFPIAQDLVKDGEGYLIPVAILEMLGIKCRDDGIEIPENPTPTPTDNGTGNQGAGNSSGGNQGGGNSGGNQGGGNTGGNYNGNNGGNSGGTATVTPPIKPTPPVETPKPPVEPSNPTGITLTDLKGRLPGLGFTKLDYMTWNYSQDGREIGRVAIKDGAFTVGFFVDNASYDNSVSQIFNLLLPTQGNRLMSIISSPFDNQRLTMDGKLVVLEVFPEGVVVTICNNAE